MSDPAGLWHGLLWFSPCACLHAQFMQQALLGLMMLAPLCAAMGVIVVNFRMAFFADAISHSAFAGVALGLLLAVDTRLSMVVFGVIIGISIMAVSRRVSLSADTVIGVFFSTVIAFGLAVVSREPHVARDLQRFLYGDILTIDTAELWWLAVLFIVAAVFGFLSYNRLLYIGLNPCLAAAHNISVRVYQFIFAALLSLVVIFSVWAVGVLLVTAMLIVPAAAARNLARSARGMFWWALLISWTCAVAGLIISAQPWAHTATGATVVLCACVWFAASLAAPGVRNRQGRR